MRHPWHYGCGRLPRNAASVPAMARLTSSPGRTIPVVAINAGTIAVFVLWLVVAGYALAYLVSH